MTLHEAIGVKCCNIDVKTGEKLTHSEIYGRAIELLGGLDVVAQLIPFPVVVLREKVKEDPYLNNTPMSAWDRASGFMCGVFGNGHRQEYDCRFIGGGIWELYRRHGITAASNSDGVCVLKEAARRLVEREEKQ